MLIGLFITKLGLIVDDSGAGTAFHSGAQGFTPGLVGFVLLDL
jgi:hypothetical protein